MIIERVGNRINRDFRKLRLQFWEAPPLQKPIFIVGTVRSGTTLLADCLGKHPSVRHIGFELSPEWSDFANIEIACPDTQDPHCASLTEIDATEDRRLGAQRGFAELMAMKGGGKNTRFLNKNPHLWNKLPFLRALFPDASLVIISRDIHSTVASTNLLWEKIAKGWGRKHYLPDNPERCWSCIPPADLESVEPSRLFPGGDVTVLAEYWLRTYEGIEKQVAGSSSVAYVKHREFVTDPERTLARIHAAIDLPSATYRLPKKLDQTRNNRWRDILSVPEQAKLETFIRENRHRIERLTCVDTTLSQ